MGDVKALVAHGNVYIHIVPATVIGQALEWHPPRR